MVTTLFLYWVSGWGKVVSVIYIPHIFALILVKQIHRGNHESVKFTRRIR